MSKLAIKSVNKRFVKFLRNLARRYPTFLTLVRAMRDRRYFYHALQGFAVTPEQRQKWKIKEKTLFKAMQDKLGLSIDVTPAGDINALWEEGIVINPISLTKSDVDSITERLHGYECHDPDNSELGYFAPSVAPQGVSRAYYKCEDLVKIPEIVEIANHPSLISIATQYFGVIPKVDSIYAWWSFPSNQAVSTQTFHRDIDTLHALKFMVYLTDVSLNSGPHVYVRGSSKGKLRTVKDKPHADDEIINKFGADCILTLTGEEGFNFIGDMFAFHKGCTPTERPRLILQVYYSLVQTPFGPAKPFISGERVDYIPHTKNFKYINQNIIKF